MDGKRKYEVTGQLFLRLLGLVYLSAFGSLWPQITGLVGSHGIVSAARLMASFRAESGLRAYVYMPTLFWLNASDAALIACCVAGCAASIVLIAGRFPYWAAGVCWALYLSLISVGQPFTGFQWDALLLESGFLAMFCGAPWIEWGHRFLLFRLMFESGVVKLKSGDPNWRNVQALRFHFFTQPLPNPLAYYVQQAPGWVLDGMTLATLAIELVAPFLLFGPRRVRQTGAWLLILLQVLIALTGNYAFFNLLTLALCVWAFDDDAFRRLKWKGSAVRPRYLRLAMQGGVAVLMGLGWVQLVQMFAPRLAQPLSPAIQAIQSWEIVNQYGLFAVMTTARAEIAIEGSNDLSEWKEYTFRYKPGEIHRGLPVVAPHQPRLDWQMWFAALGEYRENSWVGGLMMRVLEGEPEVLKLLGGTPFQTPPKYVRATISEYRFTTLDERAKTGAVWQRGNPRVWFGPVSLRAQ